MKYILFLNKTWGVDFMLIRRLEREKIDYDYVSLFDEGHVDTELYTKYGVRSTPCLLILDNDEVSDKLNSTDEIIEYLKNVQNTKIPLGTEDQTLLGK